MWRKGNLSTLLVGMQTGTASVENNVGFHQKLKMEPSYGPVILHLEIYPKNPETPI